MRTSSLSAAALLVVALGAAGPAAPAQAPEPPAPSGAPAPLVTDLPDGPRAYLPEELCDKESMPAGLEHLERLDGLGGPDGTARG